MKASQMSTPFLFLELGFLIGTVGPLFLVACVCCTLALPIIIVLTHFDCAADVDVDVFASAGDSGTVEAFLQRIQTACNPPKALTR